MKLKYKTRKTLSQILSILLVCAIGFGAVMGISALSKKLNEDTKVIHPSFEVGGLDTDGQYKETDASIYTKEAFECLGLEVKLDFDSNVSYQVYYYDDLDKFISASTVYSESMKLAVPLNATHARLVVAPIWDSDVDKDDRVCHWYDVFKYANQLEISVLKDQEVEVNLIETLELTELGYARTWSAIMSAEPISMAGYRTTVNATDVTAYEEIEISVSNGGYVCYIFYDATGTNLMEAEVGVNGTSGATTETITIPEDAAYVNFNFSFKKVSDISSYEIYMN